MPQPQFQHRPAAERGHADHGWLQSWHSFSFAQYQDPAHMGFRSLRVINEDFVRPGTGFDTHGHRDMEILTYVISGTVTHRDDAGHEGQIGPGEIQVMTAGRGILHSEHNRGGEPLHLLQIWIHPSRKNLEPGYRQQRLAPEGRQNLLQLIASPDDPQALVLHADARIYASQLAAGHDLHHELASDRGAWIQVLRGELRVGDLGLGPGDGLGIEDCPRLQLAAGRTAEFLLFDLG